MDRYARNKALPGMGAGGQDRIRAGRVLVVGAGALGSVCSLYLAGAGVGTITVADFDTVDITNLQRQVAYTEADAGQSKAETLCRRLCELNSEVKAVSVCELVTARNLEELVAGCDVVADCTDNAPSKHFLAKAVPQLGKPCVTAGVDNYVAQVTTTIPGSLSFAELFGAEAPSQVCSDILPCAQSGVFGPAAGIAATAQAAEVLKLLAGVGNALVSRLMLINTLDGTTTVLSL